MAKIEGKNIEGYFKKETPFIMAIDCPEEGRTISTNHCTAMTCNHYRGRVEIVSNREYERYTIRCAYSDGVW